VDRSGVPVAVGAEVDDVHRERRDPSAARTAVLPRRDADVEGPELKTPRVVHDASPGRTEDVDRAGHRDWPGRRVHVVEVQQQDLVRLEGEPHPRRHVDPPAGRLYPPDDRAEVLSEPDAPGTVDGPVRKARKVVAVVDEQGEVM